MYLIREVEAGDIDHLVKLSEYVTLINLPPDRGILSKKVSLSKQSFRAKEANPEDAEYYIVLEDLKEKKVVGACMISAKNGTPREPNISFQVLQKKKMSKSLHIGFIHEVLRLRFDFDGSTEVGGLIVAPEYRRDPSKLGKQLSFARFMYIAARKNRFQSTLYAELLPPFDDQGRSLLWEEIGRKFTNLSYDEADRLSRKNKEFINTLFPEGDIYTCMLSASARETIGEVNEMTVPVKKMLEGIGFKYINNIDPFDGGPHYQAVTDQVKPVKNTHLVQYKPAAKADVGGDTKNGLLMHLAPTGMRAMQVSAKFKAKVLVHLAQDFVDHLEIKEDSELYFLEN